MLLTRENFQKKVAALKETFARFSGADERFSELIRMGRELPKIDADFLTKERLVQGCQSDLYLISEMREGKIFFSAASEALISAGLAALLMAVYSGETPETVLKEKPAFLEELGIRASLSPNRSNGLFHIHLKMKQDALKFYLSTQRVK